jgi:hypothetical protein
MMSLGPEELTISKLDNMKLREIMKTTRSKLNSRIQPKQEQNLNKNMK